MFLKIVLFAICYLICSMNPSIMICKKITGQDIRDLGSGNAGTTNAVRVLGKGWGAVVFVLDAFKALLSFGIVKVLSMICSVEFNESLKSVFLVACVVGHCFPIYYQFKGGKGIATLLVSMLCIDYKVSLVCMIVGLIIIVVTKTVSKGTLCGVILLDIMAIIMIPKYILAILIVSAIIFLKHRQNIVRIMNKEEQTLF